MKRLHVAMIVCIGALLTVTGAVLWVRSWPAAVSATTVRIGGVNSLELTLPTLVALANGYFAEAGLHVELITLGSGTTARNALIAGDIDLGLLAFIHTPLARIAGKDLKIVLSLHEREIFSLLVRSELAPKVQRVADLAGKAIGITAPGSGTWAVTYMFLKRAGLTPESDASLVAIGGDPTTIYNAMKASRIDAFPTWEPITTRLIEEHIAFPLVRAWVEADAKKWLEYPLMSMTLVARPASLLGDDRDSTRRTVNAHRRALAYIRTHPGAMIAKLLQTNDDTKEYVAAVQLGQLATALERIRTGYGDGSLSKQAYTNAMKLATEYGIVSSAVPFKQAIDASFAGTVE